MGRSDAIFEYAKKELWLPDEVLTSYAEAHSRLVRARDSGTLSWELAREALHEVAIVCFAYDELTLKSRTLRQIRTLDLELASSVGCERKAG